MKFTLTMNVGDNAIRTAYDLESALIGLAQRIGNHYGEQEIRLIPWGPLAGLDGKASDVLAITSVKGMAPVNADPTPQEQAYIAAAKEMIAGGVHFDSDELEIDDEPIVSDGADEGAWVASWVWVTKSEAGICSSCDAVVPSLDNGDGFDGLCPACTEKTEA